MIHEKSSFSQVLFFDSQLSFKNLISRKKTSLNFLKDVLFDNNIVNA